MPQLFNIATPIHRFWTDRNASFQIDGPNFITDRILYLDRFLRLSQGPEVMLSDTIIPERCLKDGALIGTLFMQHLMSGEDCIHMISYNYPTGQIYGVVHRDKFVIQVDMGIT